MQKQTTYNTVDAQSLKAIVAAQADDSHNTLPEDAYLQIRVQYESRRNGNTLTKSGKVWGYSDSGTSEKIRFSMNVGEENEDSFYISFFGSTPTVYSVDNYGDSHPLGKVEAVKVQE